jgi:hypothetical protein
MHAVRSAVDLHRAARPPKALKSILRPANHSLCSCNEHAYSRDGIYGITGDTVITAVRLKVASPRDVMLISEVTYKRDYFLFSDWLEAKSSQAASLFLIDNRFMDLTFEQELADRDRANIVRITSVAFLLTLLLSWRAYIPSLRIFELSPVIEILGSLPGWVDGILLILNVVCLGWLFMKPLQPGPAVGVLVCTMFWVLQDLLRFQPYTYMYFFTIVLAVFYKSRSMDALKIMVASVYMWGGLHKINATFFLKLFPEFIEPFYTFPQEPSLFAAFMALVIFLVPVFEATIGLLMLFFPRQRRLAIRMAFLMLVVVITCLGLDGYQGNIIVWPWNIYLFLLVLILCSNSTVAEDVPRFRFDVPTCATIALFSIAPACVLFGWGHSYPAFKLYSGNIKRAVVLFAPDENTTWLPDNLGQWVGRSRTLSLVDWTIHEFELVVYPESYVFRRGAAGLCPYLSERQHATLRIYDAPGFSSVDTVYQDFPLCGSESN